jgi:exportin-2 (importin alpha re-exporter)
MKMIEQYQHDQQAITIIFSSLVLICKIFRSLNAQVCKLVFFKQKKKIFFNRMCILLKDFPAEFEDNMENWMNNFMTLLMYDNQLLHSKVHFI